MKMRTRLFLTALVLLSFGFYLLVDWIVRDVRLHYFITMEESLVDTSIILSEQLSNHPEVNAAFRNSFESAAERELSAVIYNHTKTNMNLRVIAVDSAARVQFDSRGEMPAGTVLGWRDIALALQGEYGARSTYEIPNDAESFYFYVAAPIIKEGEIIGAVSVGKPVSSIYPFMRQAKVRLIISGLVAFAAIALLLLPVSLWIIHPVRALTEYARAIRDGREAVRPKLGHGGEMSELANAFEEMRDALEGKKYVEHYVQSLTHEMKSPLAAIQGAAELLGEEMSTEQRARFLKNIRAESGRMHELVDRMLSLAALEKRKEPLLKEAIAVDALFADVSDSLLPQLQSKQVEIQISAEPETTLYGEYFLLRQAVANLLQNAVDFSPEKSRVKMTAETDEKGTRIRITDEGAGIPEYAVNRIFDRFYSLPRPNDGAKSSGLGLNFVREITRLHGGKIELQNRPAGGVEATLFIPSAG